MSRGCKIGASLYDRRSRAAYGPATAPEEFRRSWQLQLRPGHDVGLGALGVAPIRSDGDEEPTGGREHLAHGLGVAGADTLGELVAEPLVVEEHQHVIPLGPGGVVGALGRVPDVDARLQISELPGR